MNKPSIKPTKSEMALHRANNIQGVAKFRKRSGLELAKALRIMEKTTGYIPPGRPGGAHSVGFCDKIKITANSGTTCKRQMKHSGKCSFKPVVPTIDFDTPDPMSFDPRTLVIRSLASRSKSTTFDPVWGYWEIIGINDNGHLDLRVIAACELTNQDYENIPRMLKYEPITEAARNALDSCRECAGLSPTRYSDWYITSPQIR